MITSALLQPTNIIRAVSVAFLLLLVLMLAGYHLDFNDLRLQHVGGHTERVSLPLSRKSSRDPGAFIVSGEMNIGWFSPQTLHITPDDRVNRIVINGNEVDLSHIPEKMLSDWSKGFELDASAYLKTGNNTFKVTFWDSGGEGLMGLEISFLKFNSHMLSLCFLWLVFCVVFLLQIAKKIGLSYLKVCLYFCVALGSFAQVVLIFLHNPVDHIWSDPERHWAQGTDLLRIDLMSMTDPIGYQLFIAFLAKLTLKIPALVAFYTSLLALLTPWVWYRFFRELQSSKTLALAGWAFLSLLPSWMAMYSYFMQETLLLPLLGAALWASWRARRKGNIASFLLMVFLWVAAGLTRGIAIPLAAVICTWLWLVQDHKILKAVYSTLILLLIMGPLTYRSYQTVHHFAPHGMGHLASIYAKSGKREIILHTERGTSRWSHGFGSPSTGAKPFKPFSQWKTQRKGKVVVRVDFDHGKRDWDKAHQSVAFDFERFLWVTKENLIFLFFAPSWPDNNESRIIDVLNIWMRWLWAPLLIACVVAMVIQRKQLNRHWLLPSLLLAWFVVQGLLPISVNEGRYRKPFEGLIVAQVILLAAAARGRIRETEACSYFILKNKPWLEMPWDIKNWIGSSRAKT